MFDTFISFTPSKFYVKLWLFMFIEIAYGGFKFSLLLLDFEKYI